MRRTHPCAPQAGRVASQLFTMTDWGELDYLIADLPPGVGDVALNVCATVAVEGAVLVTTPSESGWRTWCFTITAPFLRV